MQDKTIYLQRTNHLIHKTMKEYSLIHKNKIFSLEMFSSDSRYQANVEKIFIQSINIIKYSLDLIKRQYNITNKEELLSTLEQVTATKLGDIYGEVYSSYLLNRKLTLDLKEFIKPYMDGV